VAINDFKTNPQCQILATSISDELWHRGYACRLWFYEQQDADTPDFCKRLVSGRPDSIVWLMPTARKTLLSYGLMSCDIRVIKAMALLDVITALLG
jgi:hypothetical protein